MSDQRRMDYDAANWLEKISKATGEELRAFLSEGKVLVIPMTKSKFGKWYVVNDQVHTWNEAMNSGKNKAIHDHMPEPASDDYEVCELYGWYENEPLFSSFTGWREDHDNLLAGLERLVVGEEAYALIKMVRRHTLDIQILIDELREFEGEHPRKAEVAGPEVSPETQDASTGATSCA